MLKLILHLFLYSKVRPGQGFGYMVSRVLFLLRCWYFFRGVACNFEAVRTIGLEYFERRRRFLQGGSGGMLPQKIVKFRVSEMPFPAFSGGHFQLIHT